MNTKSFVVIISKKLNLAETTRKIRAHHNAARKHANTAVLHAASAGDLLIKMKGQVKHGEWEEWVADHCPFFSLRTAQEYMFLADRVPKTQRAALLKDKSVREAIKLVRPPRPALPKPSETLALNEDDHATVPANRQWDDLRALKEGADPREWLVQTLEGVLDHGFSVLDSKGFDTLVAREVRDVLLGTITHMTADRNVNEDGAEKIIAALKARVEQVRAQSRRAMARKPTEVGSEWKQVRSPQENER